MWCREGEAEKEGMPLSQIRGADVFMSWLYSAVQTMRVMGSVYSIGHQRYSESTEYIG